MECRGVGLLLSKDIVYNFQVYTGANSQTTAEGGGKFGVGGKNLTSGLRQWSTKEKKFINIFRHLIVEEYNKHMDGVDLGDMHVDGHIELRSTKNYMDIVFYCMNLAVVNGWLLYRRHCSQKDVPDKNQMRDQILIKYIECLALVLVGKQPKSKRG